MLLQLLQHLSNDFNILFSFTFNLDEDVIETYYYENVEFLYQDLINIALKSSWCICQSKKHHLIFEIAIAGSKDCFQFVTFSDPHPMIDIGQIKLGETLGPT